MGGLNILEIKKSINNITGGETLNENKNIFIIIKGSIIALILTIIMLTIYALILSYTNVSENSMVAVIMTIIGMSILISSSLSNLKIKKKGIFNGAIIGLIYILGIYLISSIITGVFSLNSNSIIMIIVSILTGMIGGIIGVNIK